MKRRFQLLFIHVLVSAWFLAATGAFLWLHGYAWPAWYLVGAGKIAWLVGLLHFAVGPLCSFIVFSPLKTVRQQIFDLTALFCLQLGVLAWGCFVLWDGRPSILAFSVDRFELISNNQLIQPKDEKYRKKNCSPRIFSPMFSSICRVWARLPEDPMARQQLMFLSLTAGADVSSMPDYYRVMDEKEALSEMLQIAQNTPKVSLAKHWIRRLAPHDPSELEFIWVVGRAEAGWIAFSRNDFRFLGFVPDSK